MHQLQGFDAPNERAGAVFESFGAKRAAKGYHPVTVLDPGKPFPARDVLLTNRALHILAINIASVKIHTFPFCFGRRVNLVLQTQASGSRL